MTSTFTEAQHPRANDGKFAAKHQSEAGGTDVLAGATVATPTAADLVAAGTINDRAAEKLTADGHAVVEFSERSYAPTRIITERPHETDGFRDRVTYGTQWGGRVQVIYRQVVHDDTDTEFDPEGFDARGFDAAHRHRDTGTYWGPQRPDGTAATCDVEVAPGMVMRGERGPDGAESWTGRYHTYLHGDDAELELSEVAFGEEGPDDIDSPYVSMTVEGDDRNPVSFDVEVDLDEGTPREQVFERVADDIDEQLQDRMERHHDEMRAEARAEGMAFGRRPAY